MRQKQALFSFYTIIVFDYGLLRVATLLIPFYVKWMNKRTYEVLKLVDECCKQQNANENSFKLHRQFTFMHICKTSGTTKIQLKFLS